MKTIMLLLMLVLLCSLTVAEPINLMDISEVEEKADKLVIKVNDDEVLDLVNEQPVVHAFVDGYSSVGFQIEELCYALQVENDVVSEINKNCDDTDYTIRTNLEELARLYTHREKITKLTMLKLMITKRIPGKVMWRLARLML